MSVKDFSLADLRLFIKAVDLGGLSLAADMLKIPKASASRQLQRLEVNVGHLLLHRGSARFGLTEEGREFLEVARDVLGVLDKAKSNLSAEMSPLSGRLRIAAPVYFGRNFLLAHLTPFMAIHPQLDISIELGSSRTDLFRDDADVLIRAGREGCDELVARRLLSRPLVLCAAPSYLARYAAIDGPEDLAGHAFLLGGGERRTGEISLPVANGAFVVRARGAFYSNDPDLLLQMALAAHGVALLPKHLATSEMERRGLVEVLPDIELMPEEFSAFYLPARRNSRKIKLFTEYLADAFSSE
jgi:LysR family transcriptional regulator for bpeEF and oprC